jgi:hypothetical protein
MARLERAEGAAKPPILPVMGGPPQLIAQSLVGQGWAILPSVATDSACRCGHVAGPAWSQPIGSLRSPGSNQRLSSR